MRPSINEGFRPATDNDAILAALLQHEEDNFSKPTVENRSQKIRSDQMVYQLSQRCSARLGAAATWKGWGAESGGKGTDDHEGWRACHYYETARGERSTEIDGEITADHGINADRVGFASRSACPFLALFLQSSIPQNLGVASKVTTLEMDSTFFFADCLLRL